MKGHYRVLYNQDCTNLFGTTREPVTPEHVDRMVDEVADGGADVFLVNPNAQRVNYPSRVWQTYWDGYAPGRREFFGPVPDEQVPNREHCIGQMKRLADCGCDYLARALARCRAREIAPGVTIRMNDMHDVPWPGSNHFSRFYIEHPEFWLDNPRASGWGRRGLNYEYSQVRNYYTALIREISEGYDVEVLELDFLRFHCYFPRGDFDRHCAIMTGFIRDVRELLNNSGRNIYLTARVAATPADARELGFDVSAWAREGIVDGITAGAFLTTQWNIEVDGFKRLAGDNAAVYACADFAADRREGLATRGLPDYPDFMRAFAAGHLAAGADGVELFNFFCGREKNPPRDPHFEALREMADKASLPGKPKTYTLMAGTTNAETDGPTQVPMPVPGRQTREIEMFLAAEPASAHIEVELLFGGGSTIKEENIWLRINHMPAGHAIKVESFEEEEKSFSKAAFTIPAIALKDGRNKIRLRNEGESLTLHSIDIRVNKNQMD